MIKNIEWIKISNTRKIIDFASGREAFSKREVPDALDMCFTTASNLINQLEENGVLESVAASRNGMVGRTPKKYRLRRNGYFFLTIVFSNRSLVTLALIDLGHEIAARTAFTLERGGWQELAERLKESYRGLLSQAQTDDGSIIALGVSIQGSYSVVRDIVVTAEWHAINGCHLRANLEALFGKPVVIQNDIDAAAMYKSSCTSDNYLLYIYIGYQVGSSVIVDGKLLNGYDGLTTEIAHVPIGQNKSVCDGCGAHGCLEMNLSKGAMLRDYFQRDYPINAQGYGKDWETFIDAAINHSERALEVVREKAHVLTQLIIIMVAVTRVNSVMISGIPGELYALMYPHVQQMLQEWTHRYTIHKISFDRDAERTILLGTMDAAYQKWYPDFDSGNLWCRNIGGQSADSIQSMW